jgi:GT2 family glycosyltransferase
MSEHGSASLASPPSAFADPSRPKRSILAVIVLYRQAPLESQSLCSILQVLKTSPDLAQHFSLLVYDNSPAPHGQVLDADVPILYKHDPANGGLAPAYNHALACASEMEHRWLLLFDQDSSPTYDFIAELIACTNTMDLQHDVASIVPKLLVNGRIFSPAADFIDQIRHQYKRSNHAVTQEAVGIQQRRLGAYNSGATLRVSAMRSIGGFPTEFWLDYLDHAVFHDLAVNGYRMYIMRATIAHDASQADMDSVPMWRQRNILLAQTLFVIRAGNSMDRLLYRIFLLRMSRKLRTLYQDKRLWKETALRALHLRAPRQNA